MGKSKTFWRKKKIAPANKPPERPRKSIVDLCLADLGPEKPAVALNAHFTAAQEIGHGRDCFFCVLCARTDGKNQIAERKFCTGFENLRVFLHNVSTLEHIRCHSVQSILLFLHATLSYSYLKEIWMYPPEPISGNTTSVLHLLTLAGSAYCRS